MEYGMAKMGYAVLVVMKKDFFYLLFDKKLTF